MNEVNNKSRGRGQKGFLLWFTGLPGSGKTTIADAIANVLLHAGYNVERLDGDILRKHITNDLGFGRQDRKRNMIIAAYIASLLSKHNVGTVASFVSPYREDRRMIKRMVGGFIEVYVNTPLSVCEDRDPKGLYAKARRNEIQNFTGVSDPYEAPIKPDILVCGDMPQKGVKESAEKIIEYLKTNNYVW